MTRTSSKPSRPSKPSAPTGSGAWGLTPLGFWRRLVLLACMFCLMMVLASFSGSIAGNLCKQGSREYFILVNALQCLIGFCGAALASAVFISVRPLQFLGLRSVPSSKALLGLVLVMALGTPLMSQVIYWNEGISFPQGFSEFEQMLRRWETTAQETTEIMMATTSVGGLLVNLLVIGLLTGLSEELLFRGALQRVLQTGWLGGHGAVWVSAVVFSLLHFQFFGFMPRVLLGAFFGYLLLWTGSVWVSAMAHALNNSLFVFLHWLALRGVDTAGAESFGVTQHGFPAMAALSLTLVLVVMIGLRRQFFTTH